MVSPSFCRQVIGLAFLCVTASYASAQTLVQFEVASIRPYVSQGDPGGDSSDSRFLPGGRFTGRNINVRKLIRLAFLVEDSQVIGAPGWTDSQSYNIDARTSGGLEVTRDNISQLILALLESRFQLKYHKEMREATEYSLVVAKGGVKLKPDTGDSSPGMSTNSKSGMVTFRGTKISMRDLAAGLTRQSGRPVVDHTGVAGDFDVNLEWSSDQAIESAGPSLFTALEGIGLRLVATKGQVPFIVIDQVEKPSAN